MSDSEEEHNTMDDNLNQAIANSLLQVNMNQIYDDSFSTDVVPGVFYDRTELFHNMYGDCIMLPSKFSAPITDLELTGIIILRYVINERVCYGYIADYVDGDYAYIPGIMLGDNFMPGQIVDFVIINRRNDIKPASKVVLKFVDNMTGIDFRELLEPWIGKVYRCLVPGNILVIEDIHGRTYNIEICKVYNSDGECDFAIAHNTDLEIEVILPDIPTTVIKEEAVADTHVEPEIEVPRLSNAELRAQRLAYFDKK